MKTIYLISALICSTIATPVENKATQDEPQSNSFGGFNLQFEDVNFDDLNSRVLATEQSDENEGSTQSIVDAFKIDEHEFKVDALGQPQGTEDQAQDQEQPYVLQPFPGMSEEPQDLTGYSQFEDEDESPTKENRDLPSWAESLNWNLQSSELQSPGGDSDSWNHAGFETEELDEDNNYSLSSNMADDLDKLRKDVNNKESNQ